MPAAPPRKTAPVTKKRRIAAIPAAPAKTAKAAPAVKPATKTAAAMPKPEAPRAIASKVLPAQALPAKALSKMEAAKKKTVKKEAPKAKLKKPKMVRDSFTMPEPEYKVLGEVKRACLKAGIEVKKSELLRAGVALLQKLQLEQLRATLAGLAPLKAGRPKAAK